MGFTSSIKSDRAVKKWRKQEQRNTQILMVRTWKPHPDKKCLL